MCLNTSVSCYLHHDIFTTARNSNELSTPARHTTEKKRSTHAASTKPIPSTSKAEPRQVTTTTHPPTTASVLVNVDGVGCACNYSTSWNDVMFVFEATEATTETGLQELCTRIGIVVYGLTSRLYAPLGSLSHDDFMAIDTLPYFGDQIANLEE
ncbi:hypothetical protein Aduo_008347 [Ancylostoma duodenale]